MKSWQNKDCRQEVYTNDFELVAVLYQFDKKRCEWTLACGAALAHQSFLGVVSLLSGRLPLPGAAVVQPVLEAGRAVSIEGMLQQVGPVFHASPMPPPLSRPVQAHGMAPALNLHSCCQPLTKGKGTEEEQRH